MTLSEKYGIPPEKIKAMVKDGLLNCAVMQWEEIANCYYSEVGKGTASLQAISTAAIKYKVSERTVYNIIKRLK